MKFLKVFLNDIFHRITEWFVSSSFNFLVMDRDTIFSTYKLENVVCFLWNDVRFRKEGGLLLLKLHFERSLKVTRHSYDVV